MTFSLRPPASDQLQILNLLLDGEQKTRVQLAAATGWARNTVVARLAELIEARWIKTADVGGMRGRPAALYRLNPRAALLFVASFGPTSLCVAVTDLLGRQLVAEEFEFDIDSGPQDAMRVAAEAKQRLTVAADLSDESIAAAAIVLPCPLDFASGVPVNPAFMPAWTGFKVAAGFAAALNVPTCVDNDANAMALGALRLVVPGARNVVCVKLENGVGVGIIAAGSLQRGERGLAGEIGHISSSKAAGRLCDCGNEGCVGQIAADPAIIRDLREAGLNVENVDDVIELSTRGNPDVLQVLREAGRGLGEVLVGVAATLSPSVVILTGELTAGDHIASGVREVIFGRSVPALVSHLQIMTATNHKDCAVNGGAALALDVLMSQGIVAPDEGKGAILSVGEGLLQALPA